MGAVIRVEDSERSSCFSYEVWSGESAIHVFDGDGRQVGVFADVNFQACSVLDVRYGKPAL